MLLQAGQTVFDLGKAIFEAVEPVRRLSQRALCTLNFLRSQMSVPTLVVSAIIGHAALCKHLLSIKTPCDNRDTVRSTHATHMP